jgi:hypothetical protein
MRSGLTAASGIALGMIVGIFFDQLGGGADEYRGMVMGMVFGLVLGSLLLG